MPGATGKTWRGWLRQLVAWVAGQYADAETGLHYNFHRYYSPATGRYITADPIGFEGGINLYAYVLNKPVNWIDPWGLYSFRQGLSDTATYAWVYGTASALTPGGQTAAVVFAGIGVFSTALEIGIYSKNPFWEGLRESVKMLIPIKNSAIDKAKDEVIDRIYDEIQGEIQNEKKTKPCP